MHLLAFQSRAPHFENNDIEENGIKNEVIENSKEEENIPKLFSEEQDHDMTN